VGSYQSHQPRLLRLTHPPAGIAEPTEALSKIGSFRRATGISVASDLVHVEEPTIEELAPTPDNTAEVDSIFGKALGTLALLPHLLA
jgi:hypothetical protein